MYKKKRSNPFFEKQISHVHFTSKELSRHKFSFVRFIPCSLDRFTHFEGGGLTKEWDGNMSLVKNYTSHMFPERSCNYNYMCPCNYNYIQSKYRDRVLIMILLAKINFDERLDWRVVLTPFSSIREPDPGLFVSKNARHGIRQLKFPYIHLQQKALYQCSEYRDC